jgi:hypothetical protein
MSMIRSVFGKFLVCVLLCVSFEASAQDESENYEAGALSGVRKALIMIRSFNLRQDSDAHMAVWSVRDAKMSILKRELEKLASTMRDESLKLRLQRAVIMLGGDQSRQQDNAGDRLTEQSATLDRVTALFDGLPSPSTGQERYYDAGMLHGMMIAALMLETRTRFTVQ